jgi:predicted nucleic acid-binding protein
MRLYLDNCAFNRPFDDQSRIRIRLETEAKLYIQERIKQGKVYLVWSYILDIENDQNPFEEKRSAIERWKKLAVVDIEETDTLKERANSFLAYGVKAKDALHVAAAIEGKADVFITTDDGLLKKLAGVAKIQAANPIDIAGDIDDDHN